MRYEDALYGESEIEEPVLQELLQRYVASKQGSWPMAVVRAPVGGAI